MSRFVTEKFVETATSAQLAFGAYRLRERSRATTRPERHQMLERMAAAYMCFGLGRSHFEYESFVTGTALFRDGHAHLKAARAAGSGQ
jgi:hypothetical protein